MPYAGWHLISNHCRPTNDSLEVIFAPIVNDIVQVKDLLGNLYVLAFALNNGLNNWDMAKGYLVKANAPTTLIINGAPEIDLNFESIPLYTGWNLIAYWLQGSADPVQVFNAISSDVIQIKNLQGSYTPSFGFNNMGNMEKMLDT